MPYKCFVIREETEWDAYVKRSHDHEIYHTWHYHALNQEGEPILFVYEELDIFIAFPFIKREISRSGLYDLTSAYGYLGPISNTEFSLLPSHILNNFKKAFSKFLNDEQCVSAFSRLSPFIEQQYLLEALGGVHDNGDTIYMDLSISIDEQRKGYEKRLGRQIRKLREMKYFVRESNNPEDVAKFVSMYHKNMDRLSASARYYFSEAYFLNLLNNNKFDNKLVLIYQDDEIICGALVLMSANIIRNHLSATSENYLKKSPSKLLTDEISLIGRKAGKRFFHLGGGVGGKEDNLFQFKSYFSNLRAKDRIWCHIGNEEVYNELIRSCNAKITPGSKFFPAYRQY